MNERWCDRCRMYRKPHDHPDEPSLFDQDYQFYDGTPPHEARSTSADAAEQIRPDAATLRNKVRIAIEEAPEGLTDEEGIDKTGIAANTYRPRRQELYLGGEIKVTGKRRTRSGRMAQVWMRG